MLLRSLGSVSPEPPSPPALFICPRSSNPCICHTSEKPPRKFFRCHTSKNGLPQVLCLPHLRPPPLPECLLRGLTPSGGEGLCFLPRLSFPLHPQTSRGYSPLGVIAQHQFIRVTSLPWGQSKGNESRGRAGHGCQLLSPRRNGERQTVNGFLAWYFDITLVL